jgi:hypothetical protein
MDLTRGLPLQPARMFQDQLYAGLAQVPSGRQAAPDDFNKMFPNLPPFAGCTPAAIARVRELGRKGGLMDALDPRVTITNPLAANDTKTPHPKPPEPEPGQPQPRHDCGIYIPWPIHRSRPDIRPDAN